MSKLIGSVLMASVMAGVGLSTLTPAPAQAQAAARRTMEQCVNRVVANLAKAKTPEAEVGAAIVAQCDKPLRATLADAIKTGEAGGCTVESCLSMAQSRASDEATQLYRQRVTAR